MNLRKEIQHIYLVGAKSLGAYGGYETFVYKLTEYHQNKENIKYHVACKANGDGCMDESKFEGVTKINDHEFEFHNAHCFKIDVPQIGSAQAIYYDVAALKACCEHPNDEIGIPWNDTELKINWPIKENEMPIIADKDLHYDSFSLLKEKLHQREE